MPVLHARGGVGGIELHDFANHGHVGVGLDGRVEQRREHEDILSRARQSVLVHGEGRAAVALFDGGRRASRRSSRRTDPGSRRACSRQPGTSGCGGRPAACARRGRPLPLGRWRGRRGLCPSQRHGQGTAARIFFFSLLYFHAPHCKLPRMKTSFPTVGLSLGLLALVFCAHPSAKRSYGPQASAGAPNAAAALGWPAGGQPPKPAASAQRGGETQGAPPGGSE